MSGRPRTTSFAEGSKSVRKTFENQPPKPPLGGVKISTSVGDLAILRSRQEHAIVHPAIRVTIVPTYSRVLTFAKHPIFTS
ncbi:unnamed protein product [Danaus chrysippus]|uniref:(African queen) hypothetical protein n=1 Tax=Danaus chrysippus TaxID=151541 RepID=A0A8J2R7C4_9NEOP|nr:unnamed protein product [Danaus chrysippus]